MKDKLIPFFAPSIENEEKKAVLEVLESGWLTTGPKVKQFEQEFAKYIGARHAIAVNSGTAALHLALDAVGVREGDELCGTKARIPSIVRLYSERERAVLSVRPGLVGPSQIQWRHEVEQYPEGVETDKYYLEYILPAKLQADLDYVENRSYWGDLKFFFTGFFITIIGALKMKSIFPGKRTT